MENSLWKSLWTFCTTVYGKNDPAKSYDRFNPQCTCSWKWTFYTFCLYGTIILATVDLYAVRRRQRVWRTEILCTWADQAGFFFFFSANPLSFTFYKCLVHKVPPESSTGQKLTVALCLRSANFFNPQTWQKIKPNLIPLLLILICCNITQTSEGVRQMNRKELGYWA